MKAYKYTVKEVQSNINVLLTDMELLILQRKAINKAISAKKSQIKFWQEFDLSQLKAF